MVDGIPVLPEGIRLRRECERLRTQLAEAKEQYHEVKSDLASALNNIHDSVQVEAGLRYEIESFQREVEHLRERCASDPWWWAYSEYLDEGWVGPFETREQAETSADDHLGPVRPDDDPPLCADDERPEVSFRQASNPEGCAENELLQRENERLTPQFSGKPDEAALHKVKAKCAQMWDVGSSVGAEEVHAILEFIYRHACDAERDYERLREALIFIAQQGCEGTSPSASEDRVCGDTQDCITEWCLPCYADAFVCTARTVLAQPESPQPGEAESSSD